MRQDCTLRDFGIEEFFESEQRRVQQTYSQISELMVRRFYFCGPWTKREKSKDMDCMLIGVILNLSLTSSNTEWRAEWLIQMEKVAVPVFVAIPERKTTRSQSGKAEWRLLWREQEKCEVGAYDVLPISI